jgi:two-component system, OmpR family, phosphate regulon response regulator PhoB
VNPPPEVNGTSDDAPLVLVVADDSSERGELTKVLGGAGYAVVEAPDAAAARRVVGSMNIDVVLLDLAPDDAQRLTVFRSLRQSNATHVIAFVDPEELDALGEEFDEALSDFCVKPVLMDEVRVRVRLALRRGRPAKPRHRREFQGLILEPSTREVLVRGIPVQLTQLEFAVLDLLSSTPGTVYRQDLLARVWGSTDALQDQATVTEHVRRIRLKIEPDPHRPRWIRTVRGAGYMFERRTPRRAES